MADGKVCQPALRHVRLIAESLRRIGLEREMYATLRDAHCAVLDYLSHRVDVITRFFDTVHEPAKRLTRSWPSGGGFLDAVDSAEEALRTGKMVAIVRRRPDALISHRSERDRRESVLVPTLKRHLAAFNASRHKLVSRKH